MTDAEKAAMAWLNKGLRGEALEYSLRSQHAATLIHMLAEPRLPAEPTPEVLTAMSHSVRAGMVFEEGCRAAYRALYAHLSAPKPKTYRVLSPGGINYVGMSFEAALEVGSRALKRGDKVTIEPEGT